MNITVHFVGLSFIVPAAIVEAATSVEVILGMLLGEQGTVVVKLVDELTSTSGLWLLLGAVWFLCVVVGSHRILRWPLFLIISGLMAVDLMLYVVVRLLIGAVEFFYTTTRKTERTLKAARTFESWLAAAEAADASEGRDVWRSGRKTKLYDWRDCLATTARLREARLAGDAATVMQVLLHCLKPGHLGVLENELYSMARAGTKHAIEELNTELCTALRWLGTQHGGAELLSARRQFLQIARSTYGTSALVLSGGAIFGVMHFGVLRGLLDRGTVSPIALPTCAMQAAHYPTATAQGSRSVDTSRGSSRA